MDKTVSSLGHKSTGKLCGMFVDDSNESLMCKSFPLAGYLFIREASMGMSLISMRTVDRKTNTFVKYDLNRINL